MSGISAMGDLYPILRGNETLEESDKKILTHVMEDPTIIILELFNKAIEKGVEYACNSTEITQTICGAIGNGMKNAVQTTGDIAERIFPDAMIQSVQDAFKPLVDAPTHLQSRFGISPEKTMHALEASIFCIPFIGPIRLVKVAGKAGSIGKTTLRFLKDDLGGIKIPKTMSAKNLIKLAESREWKKVPGGKGSHTKMIKPGADTLTIPIGKDLSAIVIRNTLKSIAKDAKKVPLIAFPLIAGVYEGSADEISTFFLPENLNRIKFDGSPIQFNNRTIVPIVAGQSPLQYLPPILQLNQITLKNGAGVDFSFNRVPLNLNGSNINVGFTLSLNGSINCKKIGQRLQSWGHKIGVCSDSHKKWKKKRETAELKAQQAEFTANRKAFEEHQLEVKQLIERRFQKMREEAVLAVDIVHTPVLIQDMQTLEADIHRFLAELKALSKPEFSDLKIGLLRVNEWVWDREVWKNIFEQGGEVVNGLDQVIGQIDRLNNFFEKIAPTLESCLEKFEALTEQYRETERVFSETEATAQALTGRRQQIAAWLRSNVSQEFIHETATYFETH